MSEATTYHALSDFIRSEFSDLPKNWIVEYKDVDGDMISMTCSDDFKSMMETTNAKYLKLNIKQADASQEIQILCEEKVEEKTEAQNEQGQEQETEKKDKETENHEEPPEPLSWEDKKKMWGQWRGSCGGEGNWEERKRHWGEQMKKKIAA